MPTKTAEELKQMLDDCFKIASRTGNPDNEACDYTLRYVSQYLGFLYSPISRNEWKAEYNGVFYHICFFSGKFIVGSGV